MKAKLFSSLFSVRSRITNNRNWESETRQNVERAVVSENADGFHGYNGWRNVEKWKILKDDNEESGHPRYDNPAERQHAAPHGPKLAFAKRVIFRGGTVKPTWHLFPTRPPYLFKRAAFFSPRREEIFSKKKRIRIIPNSTDTLYNYYMT